GGGRGEGLGQAEVWRGASYERLAVTMAPIHKRVVEALASKTGERFLDLACGTGGAALVAAGTGAEVVGLDISPDQLRKAREAAAEAGLEIQFDEGDCQELPYAAGSFDAIASVFGFIFASSHVRAGAELARVSRAGGRLALTAWPEDDWARLGDRLGRRAGRWRRRARVGTRGVRARHARRSLRSSVRLRRVGRRRIPGGDLGAGVQLRSPTQALARVSRCRGVREREGGLHGALLGR